MSIYFYYALVIAIWSTTPLAIKFSNQSLTPEMALLSRVALATLIAMVIAYLFNFARLKKANLPVYLAGSLSVFPNMSVVYLAANYIPSGLISVLFALVPLVSFVMSRLFFEKTAVSKKQALAFVLAFSGLLVIFYDQVSFSTNAMLGVLLMLVSNVLFSYSQLLVKTIKEKRALDVGSFEQAIAVMTFSLPGLLLQWYFFDGKIPDSITDNSLQAVLYLALIGSLIGFAAYYKVLMALPIILVSAITLLTPMLALWLGALLLDEVISSQLIIGSGMILIAVSLYEGVWQGASLLIKRALRLPV